MAVPSLAAVILDPLLGMVDTAIVGQLGGQVLAGVGLGSIMAGSLNWIFTFLSILTVPRIANFLAQKRKEKAVEHVAQAAWVALLAGTATMLLLAVNAEAFLALVGGDPGMHAHAAAYIRARCIANPFVLLQFVQIGVLRACKDARTPLYAVLIANISNLLMDVLFVFGCNMGAGGAALATSLSQMFSCSILFGVLRQRGFWSWAEFRKGPRWPVLAPFLKEGLAVSSRTVFTLSVIMASSSVLARVGTASQAAHEILRQLWICSYQFVEAINISNQSLVSTALGEGDQAYALAVLRRHLLYAVTIIAAVGAVLFCLQSSVIGLFTSDAAVVSAALTTLPLLVFLFPLDAVCAVLDGTLMATGQAAWTAQAVAYASVLTVIGMLGAANAAPMSLLTTWLFLKSTNLMRLPFILHRVFLSRSSPMPNALPRLRWRPASEDQEPQRGDVQTQPRAA
eukprot:jgi/Ulvmu1/449/UM001_0456.1